ncbi:MAG TPA: EAL domain-containing protein [Microlunatus sp.]|jgi:EAL domain-containing protein (putative c-di-GMP-specific phosphodiesterase class I)|nr:EAL domain-containing protein [Microlunatus sp.]
MDAGNHPLERLVARLPGLAALCLGYAYGTVRLAFGDDVLIRRSERSATDDLIRAGDTLDAVVRSRGLPHVVEDLEVGGLPVDPDAPVADLHASGDAPGQGRPRGGYAGVPVRTSAGVVGVISVIDPTSRPIGRQQVRILIELARLLAEQLQLTDDEVLGGAQDDARAEIASAVAAGEIRPWYQPVIDLVSGRVRGVEALARWHRPSGDVEGPASFLPLAERSDLVIDVDRAVMAQAFADLAGWQQIDPEFRVSVNLSGRHLDRPDTLEAVDERVAAAGIRPSTVDLEITETARPDDLRTSLVMLTRFRDRGYVVWFDDFGSGWSALQDLIRLPVGGIKLDRSFAEQLGTPVDDALVGALATAAAQVGLKVTIEGIQTPLQLDRARTLGCHFAQGYLWSPPIPATEVTARLRATRS